MLILSTGEDATSLKSDRESRERFGKLVLHLSEEAGYALSNHLNVLVSMCR